MLGTGLQFRRGDDRFYTPVKARRNQNQNQNHYPPQNQNPNQNHNQIQKRPVVSTKGKSVILDNIEQPENRVAVVVGSDDGVSPIPTVAVTASSCSDESVTVTETDSSLSNLDRFLESTIPSVPAQYLSTTRISGLSTCDVDYQPYFVLDDLWEAFKEWSAYGAGVPLVLNNTDSVVQYYVPYLSGLQIYGESTTTPITRRAGGDSGYCRDSSSDGSSDSDLEMRLKYSKEQWNHPHPGKGTPHRVGRNTPRDNHIALQESSSGDDSETRSSQGGLLFEYLERAPPYSREPLACKILDLARGFPELKTLRSCDMLPTSWISVAWYPIYRIPTGPTLKDLDACFLTFHCLSTSKTGAGTGVAPKMTYPNGTDGVHKISLPIFGLASYKLKGSMWIPNGSCEHQLSNSLLQAADSWLRVRQVTHPDFQFFASHRTFRR